MNVISFECSFVTIFIEMVVAKQCSVCQQVFANKSNLNRHHASVHKKVKKNKDKKDDTKHGIAAVNLKKISKHRLHMQTLNTILWNIVLHLIENKRLGVRLSSRR